MKDSINISGLETDNIYHIVIDKIKNDRVINSSIKKENKYNQLLYNFLRTNIGIPINIGSEESH
jgi:hypothetical protein